MKKKPKLLGSGYECQVYDLHNGKVYKQYAGKNHGYDMADPLEEDDIQDVFDLAKKAAKHNLGPTVYYRRKYGYVTEKVKPCKRYNDREYGIFINKVHEIFGYIFDSDLYGTRNLGRKNGKLVLIDFGPESTY